MSDAMCLPKFSVSSLMSNPVLNYVLADVQLLFYYDGTYNKTAHLNCTK